MKINLSDEVSEDLTELRLIGGYESTQALIRILLKLYKDDFKTRFERGFSLAPSAPNTPQLLPKRSTTADRVPIEVPAQAPPKPNPPPEW